MNKNKWTNKLEKKRFINESARKGALSGKLTNINGKLVLRISKTDYFHLRL